MHAALKGGGRRFESCSLSRAHQIRPSSRKSYGPRDFRQSTCGYGIEVVPQASNLKRTVRIRLPAP
jgi:hypothetical protein